MEKWQATITEETCQKWQLDKKWAGTYTVDQMNGIEYIEVGDDCIEVLKKQGKPFDRIPQALWNYCLIKKASKLNGEPLPDDFPSKILELLTKPALDLNTLSAEEEREIFLPSATGKKP